MAKAVCTNTDLKPRVSSRFTQYKTNPTRTTVVRQHPKDVARPFDSRHGRLLIWMQRLTHPQLEGALRDNRQTWRCKNLLLAASLWRRAGREKERERKGGRGGTAAFPPFLILFHYEHMTWIYLLPSYPDHALFTILSLSSGQRLQPPVQLPSVLLLVLSYFFISYFLRSRSLSRSSGPNYQAVESVYCSTHRSLGLLLLCASEAHKGRMEWKRMCALHKLRLIGLKESRGDKKGRGRRKREGGGGEGEEMCCYGTNWAKNLQRYIF